MALNRSFTEKVMHIPVLQDEVLSFLTSSDKIIVDCTLGLGGHTKTFIEHKRQIEKIIAIEWDKRNLTVAKESLKQYKQIVFYNKNYKEIHSIIDTEGFIGKVNIVFFDLGISSPHIDDQTRGFSFQTDGPLDMRFDTNNNLSASDVINTFSQTDLAKIFYTLGEEPLSRKIAKRIVENRKENIIHTTRELAQIIEDVVPPYKESKRTVTRIFQAIRMYVNQELDNVKKGLEDAFSVLAPQGKIIVLSYHSLEDRIVKEFFKEKSKGCTCDKHVPICVCHRVAQATVITKKPIKPKELEIEKNKRARSAKMRVLQKI